MNLDKEISFVGEDIISILDFSRVELEYLISKAQVMKKQELEGKRYAFEKHSLENKKLALLFYENSTRTRTSFETGMRELKGTTFGFSGPEGTSLMKNENIFATIMMYWANHADIVVMRHSKDGSVQWAADVLGIPVINGGDGKNEHPTQALLDLVTIDELVPGIDGANIGLGGDLLNGRTIRSLCLALSLFKNITIHWAAAKELSMPQDLIKILEKRNVKVIEYKTVEEVLEKSTVYYMTRPQKERINGLTEEEIDNLLDNYRIDMEKIKSKIKILHPLPVDSVTAEIDIEVFYSDNEYFLAQAENGIFLRKALLYEILKNSKYKIYTPQVNKDIVKANNKEPLPIKESEQEDNKKYYVDKIKNGVVIDHIDRGAASKIDETLRFSKKSYKIAIVSNERSEKHRQKDLIKIKDGNLKAREMKMIAMLSKNATFNIIKDGKIVEKFKYKLCKNENCITRVITEDVPPRFEDDKDGVNRCHYCKRKYS